MSRQKSSSNHLRHPYLRRDGWQRILDTELHLTDHVRMRIQAIIEGFRVIPSSHPNVK